MTKLRTFLNEARGELLKVQWPTRTDVVRYTGMVIAMSIVLAVFLGGMDYVFNLILTRFILTGV